MRACRSKDTFGVLPRIREVCLTLAILTSCLLSNISQAGTTNNLNEIIELHRQIILLLSDSQARPEVQTHDTFIARNLYAEKRELLEAYETALLNTDKDTEKYINSLIEFINAEDLRPADKLAFIDLIDAALYIHQQTPYLNTKHLLQLQHIEKLLQQIQNSYSDDLKSLYGKMELRGKPIEAWADYLTFLKDNYQRPAIREAFNDAPSMLATTSLRGSGKSTGKADPMLVWGGGIPEKTVVLTFDDGPHYRHTDKVLDILKEHNAHAYFFAVGKNFGKLKNGIPTPSKNASKLKRALDEGHLLGNHSFTHRVLTKLDTSARKQELSDTNTLLASVSGSPNTVFRPPYGSKDSELQALSVSQGMRSVMWNIDSKDWGDPLPDSIVSRVMEKLEKKQRGILLFHDIHKQTVQALPKLLTQLKSAGYRFVDIDGNPFVQASNTEQTTSAKSVVPSATATEIHKSNLYGESWAVVVGVNNYKSWPKLSYAVNDAKAIANTLEDKFGFKEDHIFTLYNEDATRDKITELLGDTLSDPRKVKPNDRVFIFYAGHGMTRTLPSGRNLGYIIPVDAGLDKFHSRSISMTHLQDFSEMIPAKHIYYVMDSCYSGIALTRAGTSQPSNNYLQEISSRHARQILTAGGADQQVADGGPGGHSIFTWTFLQGLQGQADLDHNNIITASELGAYVAPQVSNHSNQTPAFGNLLGSQGGDFIFELATKVPVDTELSEIEKLRQDLAAVKQQNVALRQQLDDATRGYTAQNTRGDQPLLLAPKERKAKALRLHNAGMEYYKKGDYSSSLTEIRKAMAFNPSNPTIVNNYGFILYKSEKYEESLKWLEKTIELDPKRTVVYLNIADTLSKMNRSKDAIPYYEHYLTLHPSSTKAEEIRTLLQTL